MLIVVVGFQRQFGAARHTFEAARMEKCEIFEWTDPIDLINDFVASQASRFVEIRSIHHSKIGVRGGRSFSPAEILTVFPLRGSTVLEPAGRLLSTQNVRLVLFAPTRTNHLPRECLFH